MRNEESLSSKRNLTDHFGIAAEEMRKRGKAERILRETSLVPAVIAGAKRGPEDQGDRESARRTMATQEADQMEDVPPLSLERSNAVKRMAQGESKDAYQTDELKKGPRLSHPTIDAIQVSHMIMNVLEEEECKTVQVATGDYCLPICL